MQSTVVLNVNTQMSGLHHWIRAIRSKVLWAVETAHQLIRHLAYDISMRIAYDHQIFSQQPWGGISRYFVRLARELDAAGEDVSLMAHYHGNHHLEEVADSLVNGTSVSAWPRRIGKLAQRLNPPLLARSLSLWPPDIFHETYYQGSQRPKLNAPVVITVHDMIHELLPEVFRKADRTPERKKKAVFRADHIICISENTRQDLLHLIDIDPAKTSVVHHGVDMPEQSRSQVRTLAELSIQRPVLLYVGQRGGYKNFSLLLRAVAASSRLIKDVDIVCFGGGALSAAEKTLANDLGLQADQLRQEAGDDDQLDSLYQQAQLFVHTSRYEGFGLPPLEAMAHGCPVISSNASCMPEVLGTAAYYFDPMSVDSLVEALETVSYSIDHQRKLRDASIEHSKTLSWKQCAQNTLRIYRSLV